MTSLDFDASLKHTFIVLHVLFLGGSASYIILEQNQIAMFFGISSIISLIYYGLYTEIEIQRRLQAHLNLIEEAIQGSEEFKERVNKKTKTEDEVEKIEDEEQIKEKISDKNVEDTKEFIGKQLDLRESKEEKEKFIETVQGIERELSDRVSIMNYTNEKLIEVLKG